MQSESVKTQEAIRSMVPLPDGVGTKEGSDGPPVDAYAEGILYNVTTKRRASDGMVVGRVRECPRCGYYIPQ
jgi:hypothetical protein